MTNCSKAALRELCGSCMCAAILDSSGIFIGSEQGLAPVREPYKITINGSTYSIFGAERGCNAPNLGFLTVRCKMRP